MINPGNHKATFIKARYNESSEKKTPMIEIKFQIDNENCYWKGWINSAENLQRTMTAMIEALGFNGDDEIDPETKFFKDSAFTKREVSLTISHEPYTKDGITKNSVKVDWLNPLDGGRKFEGMEPQIVKTKLSQLGFKAGYLAAKQSLHGGSTKQKDETPLPF